MVELLNTFEFLIKLLTQRLLQNPQTRMVQIIKVVEIRIEDEEEVVVDEAVEISDEVVGDVVVVVEEEEEVILSEVEVEDAEEIEEILGKF